MYLFFLIKELSTGLLTLPGWNLGAVRWAPNAWICFKHVNKTHPKCREQIALHPATEEAHCGSQQGVLQCWPWEHCKSKKRSCSHRGRSSCCCWGGGTDRWAWQQNNREASPPICPWGGPLKSLPQLNVDYVTRTARMVDGQQMSLWPLKAKLM